MRPGDRTASKAEFKFLLPNENAAEVCGESICSNGLMKHQHDDEENGEHVHLGFDSLGFTAE